MVDLGIPGLGPGKVIGGGGSSTVFVATRAAFGDRVAVKLLKLTLSDDQSRRHFDREVRALQQLADAPGVVAVLDSGVSERGEPYLVLPLFDRSAQSEIDDAGPMPWPRAVRLVADAARALHYGHERGIYHRDLKPANLLLTNNDDVFVTDFGIAKLTDHSISATGFVGLTPAYAPPEILEGEAANVQSDIYSLTATLVALVNGHAPFTTTQQETPIAIMRRIIEQDPPTIEAEAPDELHRIVARALQRDPAGRHATSLELAEELAVLLAQHPTNTFPDGAARSTIPPDAPSPPTSAAPQPTISPVQPDAAPPPAPPEPPPAPPEPPPAPPEPAPQPPPPAPTQPPPAQPEPPAQPAARPTEAVPVPAHGHQPLITSPATSPDSGSTKSKTPMIVAGVAALAAIGGIIAFAATRGGEVADPGPTPVASVVEDASPEPSISPTAAPTTPPTAEPTPDAAPTPTTDPLPTPPPPPPPTGRVVAVAADGSGDVASLDVAIANAIDGDLIRLGPGEHVLGDRIVIERDITLTGAGIDATTITSTGSTQVIAIIGTSARISNLSLRSTHVAESEEETFSLLELLDVTGTVVDHVAARGGQGPGLGAFGSSTATVANSEFSDNGGAGVSVNGSAAIELVANVATGNTFSGFFWGDTTGGSALGNRSSGNRDAGFAVIGDATPQLIANTATDNTFSGFIIAERAVPSLWANVSTDNAESGFVWFNTSRGDARGNRSSGNRLIGFAAENDAAPEWIANRAVENVGSGFAWFGAASGTATQNLSVDNGGSGFAFLDTTSPVTTNNHSDGNAEGPTSQAEGATPTISDDGVIRVSADASGPFTSLTDAVAAAGEGDLIVLGAGTHVIGNFVTVDEDVAIIGTGPETTTVSSSDSTTVLSVRSASVAIADLTLTTSNVPAEGEDTFSLLEIAEGAAVTIDNIAAVNGLGNAVFAFDTAIGTVTNSRLDSNAFTGLRVDDQASIIAVANTASGNGSDGFAWFQDARGVAAANTADGNGTVGLLALGSATPRFVANTSSSNEQSGFVIGDQSAPTVDANISRQNGLAGFAWIGTAGGTAIANTAEANNSGFQAEESSIPTWTGNVAAANVLDGFVWLNESGGLATANVASANERDGYGVDGASSPELRNNSSRDNGGMAVFTNATATPTLIDNDFGG